jgi:hypothetical protein
MQVESLQGMLQKGELIVQVGKGVCEKGGKQHAGGETGKREGNSVLYGAASV